MILTLAVLYGHNVRIRTSLVKTLKSIHIVCRSDSPSWHPFFFVYHPPKSLIILRLHFVFSFRTDANNNEYEGTPNLPAPLAPSVSQSEDGSQPPAEHHHHNDSNSDPEKNR